MALGCRRSRPRIEDNLGTTVFFVTESLVHLRRRIDRYAVTDDKTRIDLTFLDALQQRLHEVHHVSLSGLHGQAFIHESAHGNGVGEAGIYPRNGNRPTFAARLNALAKHNRAVSLKLERLLHPVERIHRIVAVRFHADRIHAGVRSDVGSHVFQSLHNIVNFLVVNGFRAALLRHLQTIGEPVDGDYALRPQHERASNCELTNRAAAPDRHGVSALNVAVHRSEISSGENVRQENNFVIWNSLRNLQWTNIGKRNASILGLSAGISSHHVGVAKKTRRRVAHHFLGDPIIGIGILATRPEFLLAEEAAATGDGEWNYHAVADLQLLGLHCASGFNHFSHELMTHDVALFHGGYQSVIKMQIRTTNAGTGNAHNCITRI